MQELILISKITCPSCGQSKVELIDNTQLRRYVCGSCSTVLLPKVGDCCICCSYGSVKCISKQRSAGRYRGV
jgi:hypothetical protein